ncbi:hypothetical protein EJD96_16185 [Herbaspirillum seropedicae]|uniref:PIN domain-containing protein n=1 Tax=Herbaspirillum seropedicae TaxID=964 RepID=UPI0011245D3F|nr:PIN domain-containing protein [Herbaspirillum seropedicae]QDD65588.1 hypothetical protein EJD96_16185 [Herbaspirillum seropedicae]
MADQNDQAKKDLSKDDPKLVEKIREMVESGEIAAISVDTSIFDAHRHRLDKGLFSKLRQFGDGTARLIFPDAVWSEIGLHLLDNISNSRKRLGKDLVELCEFVGGDVKEVAALKEKMDKMPQEGTICKKHLDNFLSESKAEVLVAGDHVNIDEIMALYFERKPPFQASGPKRKEFPDAVALRTLQSWAEKNNTKVLLVSNDNDWKNYCELSNRLFLLQDLALALAMFNAVGDKIKVLLKKFFALLQEEKSEILDVIQIALKSYDWYKKIHIQADSQFFYEEDGIELIDVTAVEYADGQEGIHLIESGEGYISVSFRVIADLTFNVGFSFDKWDGGDKEYLSMGDASIENSAQTEVEVTLSINYAEGEDGPEFGDLDMDIEPDGFDLEFGEIEPSWMSDPDSYD